MVSMTDIQDLADRIAREFDPDLPPSSESTFGARIQSLDITRRRAFDATRSEVQSGRDYREAA
jgi:hypothetical protein